MFALQLLLAFAITAFGVMVAARITQMQSFMALMQMAIMPMFFLSGALFSGRRPAAVAGDPQPPGPAHLRRRPDAPGVFAHLNISAAARHALDPGVTWWGWHVPRPGRGGGVALLGLAMLTIAIVEFSRAE